MKTVKLSLSLVSLLFLSTIGFAQQIINKKVTCPTDLVEKVKKSPPGFYLDKEYFKNIKLDQAYLSYVLIKAPGSGKEAKAMSDLEIHVPTVPDGVKLTSSSLDTIENMPPGATVTFENREYKANEIVCIEVKGKPIRKGTWNPNVKLKSTAKVLFANMKVKSTWTGIKAIVN